MEKHDLAYIAGFFDGEGSINLLKSIRRRKKANWCAEYTLTVAMGQKDGETLDWIKDNLGGNICKIKRDGSYFWYQSNRKAETFLRIILPYLKYKKPQAELALKFYDERPPREKLGKLIPQVELDRRDGIRKELMLMHKTIIRSQYAGSETKRTDPKGM